MTRECCVCHIQLGEVCPYCGNDAVLELSKNNRNPLFHCSRYEKPTKGCNRVFRKGVGGVSGGYCLSCLEKEKERLGVNGAQAEVLNREKEEAHMRSQAGLDNQRAIDLLEGAEKHLCAADRFGSVEARATICGKLDELRAEREKLWAEPQFEKMREAP